MSQVQLVPVPGQLNVSIGGVVLFESPSAPVVNPGDPWKVSMYMQPPNRTGYGHAMPWDLQFTYDGVVSPLGYISFSGVYEGTSPQSISDGAGVNIGVGMLPGGRIMFGWYPTLMKPSGPPPPPPVPGMNNLISEVQAGRLAHGTIADMNSQCDHNVAYMCKEPWMSSPQPTVVPWVLCLNLTASSAIADALGGTVYQDVVPLDEWISPPAGPAPVVNWIKFNDQGMEKHALAARVAQSFSQSNLPVAIPAVFEVIQPT